MSDIIKNLRIIPRLTDYLDRRIGSRGEIFFDQTTNTLRLYTGNIEGGVSLAKSDLSNVSNSVFATKAAASGISAGSGSSEFELSVVGDDSTELVISAGNSLSIIGGDGITTNSNPSTGEFEISNSSVGFSRIAVDGEGNIDADQLQDVLNLEAGENISIAVDGETKTATISASLGSGINCFSTISVSGQSNIAADSNSDTLTLVAGSGINITTNASTDTITIDNTVIAGNIDFDSIGQVSTASLTVDQIYLPAITSLVITNVGATAYLIDQYSGNNPTVYAISGTTVAFKLECSGHPFLIQTGAGNNYNNGLIHVSTSGVVSLGSNAQGKDSGTLYWKVPYGISGGYRYQCQNHLGMVGSVLIKDIAVI